MKCGCAHANAYDCFEDQVNHGLVRDEDFGDWFCACICHQRDNPERLKLKPPSPLPSTQVKNT